MYCVFFHYLKAAVDGEYWGRRLVKYFNIGYNLIPSCLWVAVVVLVCSVVIPVVVLINKNNRYGSIQYTYICIYTMYK